MSRPLIAIAIFQVLTLAAGLLRAKGLSVLLGPSGFGVAGTIDQIILTVVQLGALGLPFTAMKFMSSAHSDGPEAFRRTSASFARIVAILALGATALSLALLFAFPNMPGAVLTRYRLELQIALLGIAPFMLNILFVNILASARKPIAAAALGFLVAAGLAFAAILGTLFGGLTGLYVATAGFGIVMTVSVFGYFRTAIQLSLFGQGVSLTRELMSSRHVIVSASSVYVTMIAYTLCFLAVRYIILARLGEAHAGLLQASLSIALAVGSILTLMNNLYLVPILNRTAPAAEKFALAHEFAGRLLPLLFAGALPAVLFPGVVIAVLFTNAFTSAATSLALFVLWQCLYQLVNIYQQLLIGLDQLRFMAISALAGFVTAALLANVLIDPLGIAGAPAAMMAGVLVTGVLVFFRLALHSGMMIPCGLMVRASYVLTMLALGSALFQTGTELVLLGIVLRLGFGAMAFGFMWPLLDSKERYLILHGPRILLRRIQVAPR